MVPYKYPQKDKYVSLFYLDKRKNSSGKNITVKIYLQGGNFGIKFKAHVQDNSGSKNQDPAMTQINSTTFVLNWRKHIDVTTYVEFQDRTYQVTGIDELDHRHTEVRITGQSIVAPLFGKVEYLSTMENLYETR